MSRLTMRCPHCSAKCIVRTSREMSRTSREMIMVCTNAECGHTFTAVLSANRTLSPSAVPDPTVLLPMSTHIRRSIVAQQMQSSPLSDYEPVRTPATTLDLFEAGVGPPPLPG